ncbi:MULTISPECIES: hypothetical protein [Streptomyces]|uniref:hypothetical protein n=1 Tax=Streptomyces TaxID=1883 RepID=UPI003319AC9D
MLQNAAPTSDVTPAAPPVRGRPGEALEYGRPTVDCSAYDAEATCPGDLFASGEGELQKAQRLQLASPLEGAGVDGPQTAGGDDIGQQGLGVSIVTSDEDRGGEFRLSDDAGAAWRRK